MPLSCCAVGKRPVTCLTSLLSTLPVSTRTRRTTVVSIQRMRQAYAMWIEVLASPRRRLLTSLPVQCSGFRVRVVVDTFLAFRFRTLRQSRLDTGAGTRQRCLRMRAVSGSGDGDGMACLRLALFTARERSEGRYQVHKFWLTI
jgi:hypothetical protein